MTTPAPTEPGTPMPRTWVCGHRGMVGSALVRAIRQQAQAIHQESYDRLLLAGRDEVDLTRQEQVERFVNEREPEVVIVAAAKVGGIHANSTYPADFIYENLMIAANVIHACWRAGVGRLLFLGSSCIYPRLASQPMSEDALLSGPLEPTNEAYAVAKIAGLKLCQAYRKQHGVLYHSAMPTNLYGPGDNYHGDNSHVIPALIRRFHEATMSGAESVTIWGSGTPKREFLHVDDLADACLALLRCEDPPDWVNVGTGEDIAILELAHLVAKVTGFEGTIQTDPTKPDGTPRKLLNTRRMRALGWHPRIPLEQGLLAAYEDFLNGLSTGDTRLA